LGTGGGGAGGQASATTTTSTGPSDGGPSGSDGGLFFDAGTTDAGDGCSAAAKLIYVVTIDMLLYSFDPSTLTFTKIGMVTCGENSAWSMGVDRSGTAWMLFASGKIYNVSTADASCTPTAYVPGTTQFAHFGMGFVADAPGSTAETLYVSDTGGAGLGKIDTTTLKLTPIAQYSPPLGVSELTGTGDARLFGFWPTSPVQVAQINETTAVLSGQTSFSNVTVGGGFAFSFWGGDFWLFTGGNVYQYTPANGTAPSVATYPFTVVGAGVSTCAPLTPTQ
jgi:hypothetical protein